MTRLAIQELYQAYPRADLLGMAITQDTRLQDVEESNGGEDTLFLFLCQELCAEECTLDEIRARLLRAVDDILQVCDNVAGPSEEWFCLVGSHVLMISRMSPGDCQYMSVSPDHTPVEVLRQKEGAQSWYVGGQVAGNAFGAARMYLETIRKVKRIVS